MIRPSEPGRPTGMRCSPGAYLHTATLLPNGKVLVTGGTSNGLQLSSTELYDPAAGTWTQSGSMHDSRQEHKATLLADGRVLVAGGWSDSFHSSAELYDPATGKWTTTGSMTTPRVAFTLTLLPNGKALATGGSDGTNYLNSAELYDPVAGTWSLTTNAMNFQREGHTATLLPNGTVLIAGPEDSTAELFDPATESWTETVPMNLLRSGRTATLLPNGEVLVAGGYSPYGGNAEFFDPASGNWTVINSLLTARSGHTATLLPNGKVLVAGGWDTNNDVLASAELYDVGLGYSNSWQAQISTVNSPLVLGTNLMLTGSQFRGISEGSGGNANQDSPGDYPVVQLRSLANEQTMFLSTTNWSTDSFVSTPVTNFPAGYALVTVFVNGIPSPSSIVSINPAFTAIILMHPTKLGSGALQFSFTNLPNFSFSVLATTNLALPVTNWTVLGGSTENFPRPVPVHRRAGDEFSAALLPCPLAVKKMPNSSSNRSPQTNLQQK